MKRIIAFAVGGMSLVLLLSACAPAPSRPARSSEPDVTGGSASADRKKTAQWVATSAANGRSMPSGGDAFDEPGVEGVPLSEALKAMGAPVNLPETREVGQVSKVLLAPAGSADQGETHFVMAVLYDSGITVSVEPKRDIEPGFRKFEAFEANGQVKYSDGRRHNRVEIAPNPDAADAAAGRIQAISVEEGTQVFADGSDHRVPALLIWNDGDFTYTMKSKGETYGLSKLRTSMMSSRVSR